MARFEVKAEEKYHVCNYDKGVGLGTGFVMTGFREGCYHYTTKCWKMRLKRMDGHRLAWMFWGERHDCMLLHSKITFAKDRTICHILEATSQKSHTWLTNLTSICLGDLEIRCLKIKISNTAQNFTL